MYKITHSHTKYVINLSFYNIYPNFAKFRNYKKPAYFQAGIEIISGNV